MVISMKVMEVQKQYDNPDVEYALMTLDEFINHRNPDRKFHGSDSYDFSFSKMNIDHSLRKFSIRLQYGKEWNISQNSNGLIIYENDKLYAIYDGQTLYYTKILKSDFPFVYNDRQTNQNFEIKPTNYKQVKYLDEYIGKVSDIVKKNMTEYPVIINRFIQDGMQYTIRSEKPLEKNKGHTIVIVNNEGYIVAQAQNEWGATLLTVAQEYRGKGLGQKLGKIWYKINPSFLSGGFTQAGVTNATRLYFERVREALESGWYSKWIKDGQISKEKVKEIIAELPPKFKPKSTEKTELVPQPLFYSDGSQTIVIYDKRFYDDQDYKYIYGVVMFEETNGKLFPYRIDYDRKFDKITTYTMLQFAKDSGYEIYLDLEPTDIVEYEDMKDVSYEKGMLELTEDKLPLSELIKYEKSYRKKIDKFDEIYYAFMEMAFQKWD